MFTLQLLLVFCFQGGHILFLRKLEKIILPGVLVKSRLDSTSPTDPLGQHLCAGNILLKPYMVTGTTYFSKSGFSNFLVSELLILKIVQNPKELLPYADYISWYFLYQNLKYLFKIINLQYININCIFMNNKNF